MSQSIRSGELPPAVPTGSRYRGRAAGLMNAVGWLAGGGSAPLVIGIIAQRESLGLAIALASTVYVATALLLLIAILFFVSKDAARIQAAP